MKLRVIKRELTKRGMRNVYESPDGRFQVQWIDRQGARSGWSVRDTHEGTALRADRLDEVAEAIDELRAR